MRFLLVDVGNTALKIGLANQDGLVTTFSLPTDPTQGGDLLGLRLLELFRQAQREGSADSKEPDTPPNACLISSVVPRMNPLLQYACERFLHVQARFAHRDVPVPLENRYERPAEVGADRLVAAFAARRLFPDVRGVISVDFGTATTFDCVSENKYLGGLICPGVLSSLHALATNTAQLPQIPLTTDEHTLAIGRNTVTSLNQGFLFGFAAMTDGLCARLKTMLPSPCKVVATGGFASALFGMSEHINELKPDLILEGLRLLHMETNQ